MVMHLFINPVNVMLKGTVRFEIERYSQSMNS
jgi:hypothetical protein